MNTLKKLKVRVQAWMKKRKNKYRPKNKVYVDQLMNNPLSIKEQMLIKSIYFGPRDL